MGLEVISDAGSRTLTLLDDVRVLCSQSSVNPLPLHLSGSKEKPLFPSCSRLLSVNTAAMLAD